MAQVIAPQGKLDLSAVAALHADLLAHADEDLVIDMRGVTQTGALCLQLMIAAGRTRAATGKRLSIRNTTDRVLDQLNLMGVTPETIAEGTT